MKKNKVLLISLLALSLGMAACNQNILDSSGLSSDASSKAELVIDEIPTQIVGTSFKLDAYVHGRDYVAAAASENIEITSERVVLVKKEGTASILIDGKKSIAFEAVSGIKAKAQKIFASLSNDYTFIPFATDSNGAYLDTVAPSSRVVHTKNYVMSPLSSTVVSGYVRGADGYFYRTSTGSLDDSITDWTFYGGKMGKESFSPMLSPVSLDVSDFVIEKDYAFNDVLVSYGSERGNLFATKALGLDFEYIDTLKNEYKLDVLEIGFKNVFGYGESLTVAGLYRNVKTNEVSDGFMYYGILTDIGTSSVKALDAYVEKKETPEPLDTANFQKALNRIEEKKGNFTVNTNSQFVDKNVDAIPPADHTDLMKSLTNWTTTSFTEDGYLSVRSNLNEKGGVSSNDTTLLKGYKIKDGAVYSIASRTYDADKKTYVSTLGEAVQGVTSYTELVPHYDASFRETLLKANFIMNDSLSASSLVIHPYGEEDVDTIAALKAIFNLVDGTFGDLLAEKGMLSGDFNLSFSSTYFDVTRWIDVAEGNATRYLAGIHFKSFGSTSITDFKNL